MLGILDQINEMVTEAGSQVESLEKEDMPLDLEASLMAFKSALALLDEVNSHHIEFDNMSIIAKTTEMEERNEALARNFLVL